MSQYLEPTYMVVKTVIKEQGHLGFTQSHIAKKLGVPPCYINTVLRQLIKQGVVERVGRGHYIAKYGSAKMKHLNNTIEEITMAKVKVQDRYSRDMIFLEGEMCKAITSQFENLNHEINERRNNEAQQC